MRSDKQARRHGGTKARRVPPKPQNLKATAVLTLYSTLSTLLALTGCGGSSTTTPGKVPAPESRATFVDPALAEPQYWLRQPATAQASGRDLDALWRASEDAARARLFAIDRRDHRGGLLTTQPMVSKQWFELWRRDAGTLYDVEESSLAPIRRTIHFEFSSAADGTHTVVPKVLIERQAAVDARGVALITESNVPRTYWYAVRRDQAMEKDLAQSVQDRVKG